MHEITFKSVLSKAILLVGIIIAITFFQNQFGSENMLVGIALITALLMFLKSDIGIKTRQAPFVIIGLFAAIVCASWLTSISPFALFAFNLVFIFAIMYLTTEDIENRAYLPFMLCYLFIQGIPVTGAVFEARLAAVFVCGLIIALVYWIIHMRKPSPGATVISVFKHIDVRSVRYSFVMRMSIGVSVAMLAGALLDAEKAMWIGLTVFSLTQPSRRDVFGRFGKRMVGTIAGTLVFVVVFLFLVPQQYQPIAILLFGFVYMFAKDYEIQITLLTVSVLATAMLLLGPGMAIIDRIILILVGAVISFVVNGIPWRKMLTKQDD